MRSAVAVAVAVAETHDPVHPAIVTNTDTIHSGADPPGHESERVAYYRWNAHEDVPLLKFESIGGVF
ncbi:MAG: hypothetical protein HY791_28805 [Deltaproteobacteria bacterium]|nr:hypothetical protein [Deltaproteobacteria bacterium]